VDTGDRNLKNSHWPLCGAVFKIADGKIHAFAEPKFEPRLSSIANLSMHSVYHTQQAALRAHCEAIEEDVFIASFGLLSPKDQPKECQSWCSWTEGVESLLPKTDLIAFVRKPSGPRKTLLVNWSDASEIVAQKMRETSESPTRIQVDEFPSDEEWASLEQRAIVLAAD
jgi:hypothetical protein